MNKHVQPIRDALDRFVSEHTQEGIPALVSASDRVEVIPSGLGENIHASVHIPQFDKMPLFDRQRMVWDFLNAHLAPEHRIHLSALQTLTSEEWDEQPGVPTVSSLRAAA